MRPGDMKEMLDSYYVEGFEQWWDEFRPVNCYDEEKEFTPEQIAKIKEMVHFGFVAGDSQGSRRTLKAWKNALPPHPIKPDLQDLPDLGAMGVESVLGRNEERKPWWKFW